MLAEEKQYTFMQALQLLVVCFIAVIAWQHYQTGQRTEARVAYIADKVDEHSVQIASLAGNVKDMRAEQDTSNAELWRVRMTLRQLGYMASVHNNQSNQHAVAVRSDIRELHNDVLALKPKQLLKPSAGMRAVPEMYYTESN